MSRFKLRRKPNLTERAAAALLAIKKGDGWLIPEPLRSSGTADEIVAHVEWHHVTAASIGGSTVPQNIIPMTVADHAVETATKTVPTVAKGKRLEAAQAEFRRRLAAKSGQLRDDDEPAPKKKKTRPMPGSRNHPSKLRKRMNGDVGRW